MNGHVSREYFGTEVDVLEELLKFSEKVGPLKGYDIPYYKAIFYDSLFGLSNRAYLEDYSVKDFESSTHPLRLVSMNAYEGLLESNQYRRRFQEYRLYKVFERTGIDFDKWLKRPAFEIDGILNDLRVEFKNMEEYKDQMLQQQQSGNYASAYDSAVDEFSRGSKF